MASCVRGRVSEVAFSLKDTERAVGADGDADARVQRDFLWMFYHFQRMDTDNQVKMSEM